MNYQVVGRVLGHIMKMEAALLLLPMAVSFVYRENTALWFAIPIAALLAIGFLLSFKKPAKRDISAREGFAIVALAWIVLWFSARFRFCFRAKSRGF